MGKRRCVAAQVRVVGRGGVAAVGVRVGEGGVMPLAAWGALVLAACSPSVSGGAVVDGAAATGGNTAGTGGATAPGSGGAMGMAGGQGGASSGGGGRGGGGAAASATGGGVVSPGPRDGGSDASDGAGVGGAAGATPSAGCGMPNTDTPATFVRHTVAVGGVTREYFVRLPPMYDPNRAYPVVFLWHGAGGSGTGGNIPVQQSSGPNAIVVGGTALVDAAQSRTQWQTNGATSPDVLFFDALVSEVSAHYCVDRSRLFSAGYSSGAWFSNLLGCVRGDVMRAYAVVAGGMSGGSRLTCTPDGIAAWFMHDETDMDNAIAGNVTARNRLLSANGCGTTTVPESPPPCVRYDGCSPGRPVVWCQTTGQGHSAQSSISGPGMWRFFSSF